ncbi:MAG: electron transfer flavoprotein subunit alpha [Alphaproteobacteria bacterium]|nr:electron transfer flavoprotein subunit alpha [Alphaproteobacteria bacterium]
MAVLVIAEHDNQNLKPATLNTVTAAQQLATAGAGDITILVAGANCSAIDSAAAAIAGVATVLVADDTGLEHGLSENVAALVTALAKDYSHVLAPATTSGKNFMPRVAASLDLQQISEISAVIDAETFVRPIYAGNALATVKSRDATKIITVRTTTFEGAGATGGTAVVETISGNSDTGQSRFVGREESGGDRPELTAARVVISGGRGMASGENYALIEPIADKLGAAMGASRAAVDAGFVPNDWQVGQTGKVVAPELYIAVGISGAIQHLAGMKDSKVIVAINKDEEAPIFQVADYGLVADLFKALPELDAELGKQS